MPKKIPDSYQLYSGKEGENNSKSPVSHIQQGF
jgi:hypothetical protein